MLNDGPAAPGNCKEEGNGERGLSERGTVQGDESDGNIHKDILIQSILSSKSYLIDLFFCLKRPPKRAFASAEAALLGPAPSEAVQLSAPVTKSLKPDII